ncbi:glycosyltransferase family 4 protein [Streptomyces sp. CA-111067]|uniref:glycosyltransferase family 4 protein n=1 Tax=Streptomyces sp. CA-111067 TaxID=3240046 RepID=UPI003D97FAAE
MNPSVATALDLPYPSPGGSVELFLDLYTGDRPLIPASAFMLANRPEQTSLPRGLSVLTVPGKCVEGPGLRAYLKALRQALAGAIDPTAISTLHLHHLAFGASPALLAALPTARSIALIHGTDLLYAERYADQLAVLQHCAGAADAIVVPTNAMADRLLTLAPEARKKIEFIPWGIPDHLLNSPRAQQSPRRTDHLRLLYAGRLTAEKGIELLLRALAYAPAVELSVAAPPAQFQALAPLLHQLGLHVHYLGWLRRPQLWKTFRDHDVLVMPSTTLEAMGLVALEAQACGLPVLYQPVPGLNESVGTSGLATDFTSPATLARDLERLRTVPGLLDALREAGRANAARYPLSATAAALTALGNQLN